MDRPGDDANDRTHPNTAYTPFIVTPCFPSYPSAHGSSAGACSTVLAQAYGEGDHDITSSNVNLPDVVLHYTNLQQVVRDVSDARVYGGIHFRFDQEAAEQLGHEVALYNLGKLMQ